MFGTWDYQIDGNTIHDGVAYITKIPEWDNFFGAEVLLNPMQGAPPDYNRSQPHEGVFTLLITILPPKSDYQSRRAFLEGLMTPGIMHTLAGKARWSGSYRQIQVYFDGGLSVEDPVIGLVTAKAIAPDPTWT